MSSDGVMHVLVVDDEPEMADMLSKLLWKKFGAVVHVAHDGESARRALRELDLDYVTVPQNDDKCAITSD